MILKKNHVHYITQNTIFSWVLYNGIESRVIFTFTPFISLQLVDQLKPGGRIIFSLGEPDGVQSLCTLDKFENGTLQKTVVQKGSFGHLQDREEQMGGWLNGTQE